MLIAEIRRKLADLEEIDPEESDSVEKVRLMLKETSEDLLTADVFGAIKYLPRIPYLQEVLRSIAENNPQAKKYRNHINFLSEYIETLKFVFWPSYPTPVGLPGSTTEPDLEISDTNILLFFEAKLHSGFGEFQIERELAVGLQQSKGREFFLVLVTAGISPPRIRRQGQRLKMTDYIKSISSSSVVSKDITDLLKKNADRVLWISWQGILSALDKAFKNHTHMCELPPAEESRAPDILEDLTELMVMRGIQSLKGFSYIVERISDINIQGSFLPWIKPISTFAFRGFKWHTSPNLSILKPLNIKEDFFKVTIKKPPFKGLRLKDLSGLEKIPTDQTIKLFFSTLSKSLRRKKSIMDLFTLVEPFSIPDRNIRITPRRSGKGMTRKVIDLKKILVRERGKIQQVTLLPWRKAT